MVITLLSLLCNISYRMQSLSSFFKWRWGQQLFWIKLERWGLNSCFNAGGSWGKWVLIFGETPFHQRNLNLIKSKNISHTLCNHDVSTKTVCTCITYFVNVSKDDFSLPIFTHISHNSCLYAVALPKSKEKHCMGKVLDWDNRHYFPLYRQLTLFYLTNLYASKKK